MTYRRMPIFQVFGDRLDSRLDLAMKERGGRRAWGVGFVRRRALALLLGASQYRTTARGDCRVGSRAPPRRAWRWRGLIPRRLWSRERGRAACAQLNAPGWLSPPQKDKARSGRSPGVSSRALLCGTCARAAEPRRDVALDLCWRCVWRVVATGRCRRKLSRASRCASSRRHTSDRRGVRGELRNNHRRHSDRRRCGGGLP